MRLLAGLQQSIPRWNRLGGLPKRSAVLSVWKGAGMFILREDMAALRLAMPAVGSNE
jgi:hypothetical protein